MLFIDGAEASVLSKTTPDDERLTEDNLREWLIRNPKEFFGESLLVIGREVKIEGINDRIDVLAIDREGNLVVLELKRDELRGNVDFQMLKYVSYVSRWEYSKIKTQFQRFMDTAWGKEIHGGGSEFNETLEEFCNEDYQVNENQRMIFVGNEVGKRIGSVVLWLREQGIDVSIANFRLFKHDGGCYLDAQTIVPTSGLDGFELGRDTADEPWKDDGHAWHIEERANRETADLIEQIVSEIDNIDSFEDPSWQQKSYVAFRVDGKNRLLLVNQKDWCKLKMSHYPVTDLNIEDIARQIDTSPENITIRSGSSHKKSEIWIDCYPEDPPQVGAVGEFVSKVVASE